MAKGLPRSLSRGSQAVQAITKRTIAVRSLELTFTGATGVAVEATAVLEGLPEGNILLLGAVANLAFAGSGSDANLADDFQGDFGIGTTPADDNTISGADVDIIASTAIGPAVAEAIGTVRAANATQAIIDNTAGTAELNLNVLLDADEVTNAQDSVVTVDGEVYLAYIVLGDD